MGGGYKGHLNPICFETNRAYRCDGNELTRKAKKRTILIFKELIFRIVVTEVDFFTFLHYKPPTQRHGLN